MNFLEALREAKKGKGIRRSCWGVGIFYKDSIVRGSFEIRTDDALAVDWEVMEEKKFLETSKEVMQAFLAGECLQNTNYQGADNYLYLDESGHIVEEDGAGAKEGRLPIAMRNDEKWWILE
jgi:hypothetical protein